MQLRSQAQPNISQHLAYYLLMSVFTAFVGGVLFTSFWSLVDEDTGVLLFFVGLPIIVGVSFMVMVEISKRLFQQNLSKDIMRRGGLLAAVLAGVLAVCVPRIIVNIRTMLPDSIINVTSSWMIVCIWVAALLISSMLLLRAKRRQQ